MAIDRRCGRIRAAIDRQSRYRHEAECRSILPLFVLPLAKGVGQHELPIPQANFGLHRCEIVAEAVVASHLAGRDSIDDKLTAIAKLFTESRFDFDRLHLDRTNILGEPMRSPKILGKMG